MWYICVYALFPSFSVFLVCILFVFLLLCKWIWTLNIIWMQRQINDVVHFFKSARVMPKTSRNAMQHLILSYKCREMLYLTISWCYGSKKILWIQSVSGLTGGGSKKLKSKNHFPMGKNYFKYWCQRFSLQRAAEKRIGQLQPWNNAF